MQSRLLIVPHDDSQNRACNSDPSLQNTPCSAGESGEHPLPFRFSAYLQPVLQTLIQHDKIRHALSRKGKLLEQFNREQRDSDAGLSVQKPNQKGKGCRGKLKAVDKAQKAYGREFQRHLPAMEMNAITDEIPEQVAGLNEHEAYRQAFSVDLHGGKADSQPAVPMSQQKVEKKIRIKHPSMPDINFDKRPKVTGVSYDPRRHHWRVRWSAEVGKERTECFPVGAHGAEMAYQLAVQFRQKMLENGIRVKHPSMPDIEFDKRPKVMGVSYDACHCRWRVDWPTEDGKRHTQCFSVGEHGAEKAYQLAVRYQKKLVEEGMRINKYPSVPDSDFDKRPKVTGVCYDTRSNSWRANWCAKDGKQHAQCFPVGEHGAEEAYQLAVQHRQKVIESGIRIKYPAVPDSDFDKRPKVTGVCYDTRSNSWRAYWHAEDGKRHEKYFPVGEHGAEEAYQLAVQHRRKMVEKGA